MRYLYDILGILESDVNWPVLIGFNLQKPHRGRTVTLQACLSAFYKVGTCEPLKWRQHIIHLYFWTLLHHWYVVEKWRQDKNFTGGKISYLSCLDPVIEKGIVFVFQGKLEKVWTILIQQDYFEEIIETTTFGAFTHKNSKASVCNSSMESWLFNRVHLAED